MVPAKSLGVVNQDAKECIMGIRRDVNRYYLVFLWENSFYARRDNGHNANETGHIFITCVYRHWVLYFRAHLHIIV